MQKIENLENFVEGQYWAKYDGKWIVVSIDDEGYIYLPKCEYTCDQADLEIDEIGNRLEYIEAEKVADDAIYEQSDKMWIEPGYEPQAQEMGFVSGAKWMRDLLLSTKP